MRRTIPHYRSSQTSNLSLQLPASWRIHNVFHATLLKPYKENEIYGPNFPEPPSELENNEEVYEVDSILNHRKRG